MAGRPSSASPIAWAWALEALANFREVDASTIKDLFLRSPEISNDIGKNAREAISFRMLENLFDSTTITKPVVLASNPKVGFGLSDNCEDVLHQILEKDQSEKLESDVQAYVMHKRCRLPKCALEKLKDAILEGKHPSMAFLKQRSGIVTSNQFETRNDRKKGDCNISTGVVQGTDTSGHRTSSSCTCSHLKPSKKPKLFPRVSQPVQDRGREVQKEPTFDRAPTDEYENEMSYIATKKQDFMTYACKGREDHSSMTHWKEENGCFRCQKGGDGLLVCSSDACPFVFHDSCLVHTMTTSGAVQKFYCPFCRYTGSLRELHAAKEKASLARKDLLMVFNGSSMNHRSKETVKKQSTEEREQAQPLVIHISDDDNDQLPTVVG